METTLKKKQSRLDPVWKNHNCISIKSEKKRSAHRISLIKAELRTAFVHGGALIDLSRNFVFKQQKEKIQRVWITIRRAKKRKQRG